jgi:hypothetical protein
LSDGTVVAAGSEAAKNALAEGRRLAATAGDGGAVTTGGLEESEPEDNSDEEVAETAAPIPKGRILLFSSEHLLDHLQDSSEWGCDGTFSITPKFFNQLWSLHIRLKHTFVPTVFCLLSGKSEALYSGVLTVLKQLWPQLHPTSIASDFKKVELRAFSKSFPGVFTT